jgi:hypothetical protein
MICNILMADLIRILYYVEKELMFNINSKDKEYFNIIKS